MKERPYKMRASGVIGLLLVIIITTLCIFMGGSAYFFNGPSLIIVVMPCIGLGMMIHGKQYFRALCSIRHLFRTLSSDQPDPREAGALRDTIVHVYAMGAIGTMIGWIQMLVNCQDFEAVPVGFAVSILTLFYSLLISELLLRPAAKRIEWQCKDATETQNH